MANQFETGFTGKTPEAEKARSAAVAANMGAKTTSLVETGHNDLTDSWPHTRLPHDNNIMSPAFADARAQVDAMSAQIDEWSRKNPIL